MSVVYPKLAVIGCGLIGSSVIRAARASGAVSEVVVYDASPAHRQEIAALGYADRIAADPADAVQGADLVVLAVPVLAMAQVARACAAGLKPGATVTDTGGRAGGSITASLFLKEFAGDLPWVHIDIAGTAWCEDPKPYQPKGATGVAVRTLAELGLAAASWAPLNLTR